ncbi:MAG: hypothetical protein VYA92_03035 [Actinomycetota bacterium]|nr:hypothetical protein [Actinomycetota bacterium]MEC8970832.1 hypothetical protein [Actinomycetota bacterium]MEC9450424.1 hypothetical protein [Actinomycetota bacterium]
MTADVTPSGPDEDAPVRRDLVNGWLATINPITKRLVAERTSYSSQLIPVTPYVMVSCIEAFLRYPDVVATIAAAMEPEEIGMEARRPGCQANSVFLWGVANFFLIGRNVLRAVDPAVDDGPNALDRAHTVLDFWARTSRAYRGGDHLHAAEVDDRLDVFDEDTVSALVAAAIPVDDGRRDRIRRANATIINHLFLLYFDTRVGHGDTGPYLLADGRKVIIRDYYRLAESDLAWSSVAGGVPYGNLTAVLVLEPGVEVRITDFGTTVSTPEDYLDHLSGFALFTSDGVRPGQPLTPLSDDEMDAVASTARVAQRHHYRDIAAMGRDQRIASGAYVYFTFLRPFAELAGVADDIDWTCPRDTPADLYPLVTADVETPTSDPDADPYPPFG